MAQHILVYHAVADGWEPSAATVSVRRFRDHCAALADDGWRGVRLDALVAGHFAAGDRVFAFTADDGYASLARMIVPTCARYGWHGTAFIPTAVIGSDGSWDVGAWRKHRHVDWPALVEIAATGWEIGAHGVTHRALTDLSVEEAWQELRQAREEIEERLGLPATSVAYPFGAVSPRVAALARDAGYRAAVTMHPGPVERDADLMRLPRWPVYRMDAPQHLLVRLNGPAWARAFEQARTWAVQQFAQGTRVRMRGHRTRGRRLSWRR